MNKILLFIIIFLHCGISKGQNLVQNSGFESYSTCPNTVGEVNKCSGWNSYGNSSDYFNVCDTFLADVPQNALGFQYPYAGDAYCGLYNYDPSGYREYIGSLLTDSLFINVKYYVSLAVVLSDQRRCKSNNIGVLFSTVPYSDSIPPLQNNFAHFSYQNLISDTLNWLRIAGSFIADSNYKYIVVGNFFDNSNTDTLDCGPGGSSSYIYIENVCVSTDSLTCSVTVGVSEPKDKDELILFPNPFTNELIITVEGNNVIELNIYDTTGRKIFKKGFRTSTAINTEHFAKGFYIYELSNIKGILKTGKLIKD